MRSMVGAMRKSGISQADESLESDAPLLETSSLIDVCFLLLIYFLVTTTIQPREQDLLMNVPTPGVPMIALMPMRIDVLRDGEVVLNSGGAAELVEADEGSRELPRLKERLDLMVSLRAAGGPRVLLCVHDEVEQQRYIDVLNCLADAGVSDIALLDAEGN